MTLVEWHDIPWALIPCKTRLSKGSEETKRKMRKPRLCSSEKRLGESLPHLVSPPKGRHVHQSTHKVYVFYYTIVFLPHHFEGKKFSPRQSLFIEIVA